MALRNIRLREDEILRKVSRPVKELTPRITELIADMKETMIHADGVGLSAVQVGVLKRIIVVDTGDFKTTIINPEIIEQDGTQCGDEGCLSVPGVYEKVTRPNHVKVKGLDENFNPIEVSGIGLDARALCHEIDHLNGILFIDRVDKEEKLK